MSRLFLVRHGITKLHQDDRFWGSTDVTLSDKGIRQAEQLRDRLAKEKIKAVYTSTLSRARLTAEIITSKRKLDIHSRKELCECNFGYVEGLTYDEINIRYPELAQVLSSFDTSVRFPGGESFEDLDNRVQKFLVRLSKHKPRETVLIVAHGSPLKIIICHLLGIDIKHWRQLRLDLASLSIMDTFPNGGILNSLNDVSHLTF